MSLVYSAMYHCTIGPRGIWHVPRILNQDLLMIPGLLGHIKSQQPVNYILQPNY